jgi:hypothetical protein
LSTKGRKEADKEEPGPMDGALKRSIEELGIEAAKVCLDLEKEETRKNQRYGKTRNISASMDSRKKGRKKI